MGFAKYFNKDLIALNKKVSSESEDFFKKLLLKHVIGIQIDEQVLNIPEAEICAELLVRLLSRLYPRIQIFSYSPDTSNFVKRLEKLSKDVNSNIELVSADKKPTFILSLAQTSVTENDIPHLYLGSDNWIAQIDANHPLDFKKHENPFGASVSACLAASNVFRFIFQEQLGKPLDSKIDFSVVDFELSSNKGIKLESIKFDDITLVGAGAIGSAAIWIFSKLKNLSGSLNIIDQDNIEDSNLQRYILFTEKDVRKRKVTVAKKYLRRGHFKITDYPITWEEYVDKYQNKKCNSSLVAVAIDSKQVRINIQGSLPLKIINSYTDEGRFGISRHFDFKNSPCLACLYIPFTQEKSRLTIITEELNMVGQEKLIYTNMKDGKLIDDHFIQIFCDRNNLPPEKLNHYKGKKFGDFYLEMICGYKMLELKSDQQNEKLDVPLSFQSCMAGIMLAAEVVLESIGAIRHNVKDVSQFYVLNKIDEFNPSHTSRIKNQNGNCICGDEDFISVYDQKWFK